MKVIGFGCSPRKGGNTDILVEQVLTTAKKAGAEIEFLRVSDMKISPCDGCWTCKETGQCHIKDDMQDLYSNLLHADGIVIGSPTHMAYNVSGQAQVFFDRTLSLWQQKKLRNKVGGSAVVSEHRGGICCIQVINSLYHAHRIINAGYTTGYGFAPGDIRKDERAFRDAVALGERLCNLIQVLKKGGI